MSLLEVPEARYLFVSFPREASALVCLRAWLDYHVGPTHGGGRVRALVPHGLFVTLLH